MRTAITVSTPTTASGQITMSRTYDPRGKLVQTVQDVTSPTAHSITTAYAYDAAGNLLAITDSGNNQLKAFYDDLGRKIEVDDPDRGKWFYTWDGLGRVRTQKDARGITLAYQYDAIGRMERRFILPAPLPAPAPAPTWLLEANWQYDLNNKLGTLGTMYGVPDNTAGVALDPAQPAAMFHRDYKYDALLRPWSVSTHVPAGSVAGVTTWTAQDLTIEYGYDYNYGRMKAMSSPGPNQEFVRFDYDVRGIPLGETPLGADGNLPAGATAYRRVNSMSIRGQIMDQTLGNGIEETTDFDESTGLPTWISATGLKEPSASCPTAPTPLVRQLTYTYDHFLNLATQERDFYKRDANGALLLSASCTPTSGSATESYQYDELQRLTQTSRTWTNVTPDALASNPTQYFYTDLGNIAGKSDYAATYGYPPSGANTYVAPGPHAVTSLSNGMTFAYDANGNLTSSTGVDARGVTFDNLDRPITITKGSVKTVFRYAPDGERFLQATSTGGTSPYPKTIYYVDKLFEREIWNGSTEERVYLKPSTVIHRLNTARDVRYLTLDRLGSVEAVTTSSAAEYTVDQHSFDAFGKPRKGDFTTGTDQLHSSDYNVTTEHGFTGHEHLDETYLIHMNGRVYDYRLGRFLSVDPIISNPTNSQSINPYSYIGNNPLSGVDPTGYQECFKVTGSNQCYKSAEDADKHGVFAKTEVSGNSPYGYRVKAAAQEKSGADGQGTQPTTNVPSKAGAPAVVGASTRDDAGKSDAANASTPRGGVPGLTTFDVLKDSGGFPDESLNVAAENPQAAAAMGQVAGGVLVGVTATGLGVVLGNTDVESEGGVALQTAGEEGQAIIADARAAVSAGSRALSAADLGIKGNVEQLRGTFTVADNIATVRIDMVAGKIENPFQIIENLKALAASQGATTLRIEGTLANPRLMDVLVRRYEMVSEGGVDHILIRMGK